jgi:hypothetical protein
VQRGDGTVLVWDTATGKERFTFKHPLWGLVFIVEGMAEAGLTLRRLLTSKSEAMQHRAAESLLTHGAQLCALAELQDRVAELEGRR